MVELVRDISKECCGDARVLQRNNPLLADNLLNLAGVCLEGLKVAVLCENLNLATINLSFTSISRTLCVELVYPVNWACRCRQYAMVVQCRHVVFSMSS